MAGLHAHRGRARGMDVMEGVINHREEVEKVELPMEGAR